MLLCNSCFPRILVARLSESRWSLIAPRSIRLVRGANHDYEKNHSLFDSSARLVHHAMLTSALLTPLPEAGAQDAGGNDEVIALSPFEVVGEEGNNLWSVNQSSGGTRIAVPVGELPFTMDVLTTEFMDDLVLSDLAEALPYISTVTSLELHTGATSGHPVRGFSQFYQLRDGFYRNGVVDKTLIDRVEVVKGPYAAVYGRSEPGGVINYIPKRPILDHKAGKLSFQYGENSTYRVQWEHNQPIGKKTAALIAGSYFERDFDLMWTHERTKNLGVVLTHQFSDRTQVILEYEYLHRRNNRGRPLSDIRIDGKDADGNKNKYTGEWAWDFFNKYGWVNTYGPGMWNDRGFSTINATLKHRFADNIHARIAYNYSDTTQKYNYYANMGATIYVDPDTGEFTRWAAVPSPHWRLLNNVSKAVQADLTINFNTGNISHTSLLTFDYSDLEKTRVRLRAPRGRSSDVHWDIVDYSGGVPNFTNDAGALHGSRNEVFIDYDETVSWFTHKEYYSRVDENRSIRDQIYGVFFMHRVKLFEDKLILMAGGRYDEATTKNTEWKSPDLGTVSKEVETKVDDFSYNIGANYNLNPHTILYGSYATSFNPKGEVFSHTGEPFPNEQGLGYEVGIRSTLLKDKLAVSASYFNIERENVISKNPDFDSDIDSASDKPEFIPGGLDRAQGWEFSANGNLTRSWGIRASVGLVDTEHITNENEWLEGLSLRRVPDYNWSLTSRYRFREGKLKGLSLIASYRANGDHRIQEREPKATDLRNNLRTDDAGWLDITIGYRWKTGDERFTHNARLAVKNVLDDIYLIGNGYLSNGRQVVASYSLGY